MADASGGIFLSVLSGTVYGEPSRCRSVVQRMSRDAVDHFSRKTQAYECEDVCGIVHSMCGSRAVSDVQKLEDPYLAKSGMLSEIVCYGPFDRMPENLLDNVYWFGGWECRTPGYTQEMETHGITNPYRDVINNDSIYLVDDNIDLTLKYIRQYYDSSAQAVFIKTIGNVDVYQIRSK